MMTVKASAYEFWEHTNIQSIASAQGEAEGALSLDHSVRQWDASVFAQSPVFSFLERMVKKARAGYH